MYAKAHVHIIALCQFSGHTGFKGTKYVLFKCMERMPKMYHAWKESPLPTMPQWSLILYEWLFEADRRPQYLAVKKYGVVLFGFLFHILHKYISIRFP